jgi:hypothetical protein
MPCAIRDALTQHTSRQGRAPYDLEIIIDSSRRGTAAPSRSGRILATLTTADIRDA